MLEGCVLEVVSVKGKPLKHFMESDGTLVKTDPLVFACKNEDAGEIQISMHYEGLPMEPLRRLFRIPMGRLKFPAHFII